MAGMEGFRIMMTKMMAGIEPLKPYYHLNSLDLFWEKKLGEHL